MLGLKVRIKTYIKKKLCNYNDILKNRKYTSCIHDAYVGASVESQEGIKTI